MCLCTHNRLLILLLADGPYLAHSDTSILLVLFNKVLDLFLDITLILLRTHLPNSWIECFLVVLIQLFCTRWSPSWAVWHCWQSSWHSFSLSSLLSLWNMRHNSPSLCSMRYCVSVLTATAMFLALYGHFTCSIPVSSWSHTLPSGDAPMKLNTGLTTSPLSCTYPYSWLHIQP